MTAVARFIDTIQDQGGLRGTDIADLADVSPATVHRWKVGSHLPHASTQLLLARLHYIISRLDEYYTPEGGQALGLCTAPQLDGEGAIDLIVNDRTADVIAILDRLDAEGYL